MKYAVWIAVLVLGGGLVYLGIRKGSLKQVLAGLVGVLSGLLAFFVRKSKKSEEKAREAQSTLDRQKELLANAEKHTETLSEGFKRVEETTGTLEDKVEEASNEKETPVRSAVDAGNSAVDAFNEL
mgnify:FL=1